MPREWIASSACAIWPAMRSAERVVRPFADARRERARGQELHRDVRLVAGEALVVDARDVGAVEARHELVLAHEALEEHPVVAQRAVEQLERHAQPVVLALGEEDLRLPPLAYDVHHVVARDGLLFRHRAILPFHLVGSVQGDKGT
jgi:hypothetical protein